MLLTVELELDLDPHTPKKTFLVHPLELEVLNPAWQGQKGYGLWNVLSLTTHRSNGVECIASDPSPLK
jgi:hypothetical protein